MKNPEGNDGGLPTRGGAGITHRPKRVVARPAPNGLEQLLLPGDIVMVWGGRSAAAKAIMACQRALHIPEQACRITHVALYAGDGEVIHATWSVAGANRVRRDNLASVCGGHTVSLASALPQDARGREMRAGVVAAAEALIDRPYSLGLIALAAVYPVLRQAARNGAGRAAEARLMQGHVCSTLVFDAYLAALRHETPLDPTGVTWRAPFIMPGYFFWLPTLADVVAPPALS